MKRLKLVVSLPNENSYHLEQARAAKQKAAELGADVTVIFADNSSLKQSEQVLAAVQSQTEVRPDAILCEPLTATALARAAEASVEAGIGWAVLNKDVEYLENLRQRSRAPVFTVTRDHTEIGRIQGRQFAALLPHGGTILYIQGPATSLAAVQRSVGMESVKPKNIKLKTLRSPWTEQGGHEAVSTWLELSTSYASGIDLIGCQYDEIAMGARVAFTEVRDASERDRWLALPFTGIDGLVSEGQAWVDQGLLAATIIAGAATGVAVEMVVNALNSGSQPPSRTLIELRSYPPLERLTVVGGLKQRS
jgi:ribose transport system substrate-binding protein